MKTIGKRTMGTMLRTTLAALALSAAVLPAHAEVWMVKVPSVLGCRDRETLIQFEAAQSSHPREGAAPTGCVVLYSGDRLLDQPEVGVGFNDYLRVETRDGSTVFVRSSAVVLDPGTGSVTDNRPE
jgi:hypothetical protein